MKNFIKQLLRESITDFEINEDIIEMIGEAYPTNFNMDEFKKLNSFNKRIKYCQDNLQRISSGSSRIVYKVDDEKVLKLAKNEKGLAQNEIEIEYGQYYDLEGTVAKIFEFHPDNLWVEMELARKATKPNFQQITGLPFDEFARGVHNYGIESGNNRGFKYNVDKEFMEKMWENEFSYDILSFIGNYGLPSGDLERISSYGVVNRNGSDSVVLIDYGLTHDVYQSYYS